MWYTMRILLLLITSVVAAGADCGVYLATSTIPNAGFGMFAAKAFRNADTILEGDIAVPLEEVDWNNGFEDFPFVWDDYTWSASQVPYGEEEVEDDAVSICSFGIGSAMNSFLALVNVGDNYMAADNAGLHRAKDPGAGAFSPYHDRKTIATRDILEGEELFVSYGSHYFESRSSTYGYIPLYGDFDKADTIVQKYVELEQKLLHATTINDSAKEQFLVERLWDLVTNKLYGERSRTINALPKNYSDIPYILREGTSRLHFNRSLLSLDYLQEHGKCMDNLRPGLSKIPQAGRGAFATRKIPKGGLVAPAPLIHIPFQRHFDMYEPLPIGEDGKTDRNMTRVYRKQLLTNYCFGHKNSTVLLSSYGVITNLINHSSQKPNARIVWSDLSPHPEWMKLRLFQLQEKSHAGLMVDYVALRDIEEGEEVLIDYGTEWEAAWQEHVANWKPAKHAERYHSGYELNENINAELWLNTEYPFYAPSIQIWIHDAYREMAGVSVEKEYDYHLVRIVGRYLDESNQHYYNAEMIRRKQNLEDDDKDYCTERLAQIIFHLPRDAFYFEDDPYTRDHQLATSFRHAMMIPDDMFPEAWKNAS